MSMSIDLQVINSRTSSNLSKIALITLVMAVSISLIYIQTLFLTLTVIGGVMGAANNNVMNNSGTFLLGGAAGSGA